MTETSRFDVACVATLLTILLAASLLTETASTFPSNHAILGSHFALGADPSYQLSVVPTYLQQGFNTTITVSVQASNNTTYTFKINVTNPNPAGVSHELNITVATNATGFGDNSTMYWGDFSGAHTNLVGIYNVALKNASTNETLPPSANFTVGLVDKLNYRRNELVQIRGSGYGANESVTLDLKKTNGSSVIGYPKNMNASTKGVVSDSWRVPVGAALGVYTITISNATTTVKTPSDTQNFTVFGVPSYSIFPQPSRIQEGLNTTLTMTLRDAAVNASYPIRINVTDPRGKAYNASLFIATNGSGFGSNSIKYWSDFANASTNYVGTYTAKINETYATANFTVGLTNKLEYRQNETVSIRAVDYQPSENVTISLKIANTSVTGYPKILRANINGVLTHNWTIPLNATPGTYNVSITNATSGGTVKIPRDVQDFEVLGVICRIQARNLAGEGVAGALVEVYNATTPNVLLINGNTTSTGWARFNLDSGNYTFKAFFKNVEVGSLLNQNVTVDTDFELPLRLVNVVATVETEGGFSFPKQRVPFVVIALKYNYTTRKNENVSETTLIQTNITGIAEARNLFTDITYGVEAKRYGALFNSTTFAIEVLPISPVTLHFLLPTYTLNVHALDSKNHNASEIQIKVYEWASGVTTPLQSLNTNESGDASFLLPFGRYRLRAYKGDVFLNETVVNLFENPLAFTLNFITANLDVTVSTLDYFGQPIANAEVKIERIIDQGYMLVDSKFTGADGITIFTSIVGGDFRISTYVAGRLAAVKTQFLGVGSNQVVFRMGEYVAILGYPIGTGLFALFSFILVLVVALLVLARGRLVKAFRKKLKR